MIALGFVFLCFNSMIIRYDFLSLAKLKSILSNFKKDPIQFVTGFYSFGEICRVFVEEDRKRWSSIGGFL